MSCRKAAFQVPGSDWQLEHPYQCPLQHGGLLQGRGRQWQFEIKGLLVVSLLHVQLKPAASSMRQQDAWAPGLHHHRAQAALTAAAKCCGSGALPCSSQNVTSTQL